ncbi:MAG: HD-GYP domain-containing protein [Acetivibrionales bacterium]|jgi:putative nucleotidyltransferase with HDIG domain
MSKYILEEDIYARNGTLLLSKGNIVTEDTIAKLKRHGIYLFILEKPNNYGAAHNIVSDKVIQTFGERKNIRNNCIFEHPNKILSSILFESKAKPWWICVNALTNSVEWIYTHSIDVAIISLMIAMELGFNDDRLWNIGLGAFLHDIGKLLVPKKILQKPGPLTDIEKYYIRQHCELGMSSIEPLCLPKECTDIILQHHERLDGSGYPKGLKGDEICLNSKIVMVADSVDAITSDRPYRQGRKIDEAIKALKSDGEKYSIKIISVLEKILE